MLRWSSVFSGVRGLMGRMFAFVKEPSRAARQKAEFDTAKREFHFQRERLEAKFFELAAGSGKPRGLRWTECDFENDVTYARQRSGGRLCAFVAVTISFEAIEGGLMEGVEAVGNERAATVRESADLPYPYGSVIVMETSGVLKDEQGRPRLDDKGRLSKGDVVGLHVMRREKGFGEAYGKNRTGEWEYVEYRADGTYITPPRMSFACAECHVKAGGARDFVYRGRLPEKVAN